jgi:hypothetical protein
MQKGVIGESITNGMQCFGSKDDLTYHEETPAVVNSDTIA